MKTQKTLSIVITAYNVQDYIEKCLNSIEPVLKDLEVIVVNDGSTDKTLEIINSFAKKHQEVTVVDKENGGHGSVINVGLKKATGKYFRVLDGDDWLSEATIKEYVQALKEDNADLVLTNYSYAYVESGEKDTVDVKSKMGGITKIQEMANLNLPNNELISLLTIHSCTIKTDALKKVWGSGLLEKTYYEDQEYVAKIILAAESAEEYGLDVYQYLIGRNEQSMSSEKLFKKRKDHERVLGVLVDIYNECMDEQKKTILLKRIQEVYKTHYWIYYYHPGIKKSEKQEFISFKKQITKKCPNIAAIVSARFKLRLFLGRIKSTVLK